MAAGVRTLEQPRCEVAIRGGSRSRGSAHSRTRAVARGVFATAPQTAWGTGARARRHARPPRRRCQIGGNFVSKRGNGEGSIYQDSRGLWRASITLENGRRRHLSRRTRQEVAKKLAAALQAREQGTIITAPRQTVAQFFARWLDDVVRPNLRPRGYSVYEGKTRLHILPELGRLPMTALTPQHLQRLYARKLEAGL